MEFSTKWLAEVLPEHKGAALLEIVLHDVCASASDSMKKGLFVPLSETEDHAELLKEAISNGAVATLWKKEEPIPDFVPTEFPVFLVEDMRAAIMNVAQEYVRKRAPHTVCITGDRGVSETKQFVTSILDQQGPIYVINESVDSELQLSLQLLNMPQQAETCVVEFDLFKSESLFDLSFMCNPDLGIITAVPQNESDLVQKCVEMFAGLKKNGKVVLDGDDPAFSAIHQRKNVLTCGFQHENEGLIVQNERSNVFTFNGVQYAIENPDSHIIRYAGYSILVGNEFGLHQSSIQQGLTNLMTSSFSK